MEEPVKIKSDNSFVIYFIILLLGGIAMFWGCYAISANILNSPYPQIADVFFCIFFGVLGFLSIIMIYHLDSILIYSDRLKVKSIFGNTKKTIFLDEITFWTEIEKENKHKKWTELTLYTERTKLKLSSSIYNNYPELKKALVRGKRRDFAREKKWSRRNNLYYAIGFTILGGLFLYLGYHYYMTKDEEIIYSDLHTIRDVITNKAEIHKGSKGSKSIQIRLKSYPPFNFDIDGLAYSATYASEYVANVKVGDTLYVEVLKEEYEMKLSKEKPLGFWDKTVNYSFIRVYELRDKNRIYLSLSGYNEEHKSDVLFGILLYGLAGAFILGTGIYLFIKK
jgi:hypothetical protein